MKLNFKTYGKGQPVIFMHGLFGMGDNWRTIARMLEDQCQSIVVDMRNHGRSPHDLVMNFEVMATDILELMDDLGIEQSTLLGHSMGGKVAMHIALHYPERVTRLIVVDIAPKIYPPHHATVIQAITSVDFDRMQERSSIEQAMAAHLGDDQSTIQFLMKNISRDPDGRLEWKPNMPVIINAYENLMEDIGHPHPYEGPVLFIRGERSRYITDSDVSMIKSLFPAAELVTVADAGHWVHADAPEALVRILTGFLQNE